MDVEVRFGAERQPAGIACDGDTKMEDMRAALRVLTELAAIGLFAPLRKAICSYEFHFLDREEWMKFVEKPNARPIEADRDLLDAALKRRDGRIVVIEENFCRVYERLT